MASHLVSSIRLISFRIVSFVSSRVGRASDRPPETKRHDTKNASPHRQMVLPRQLHRRRAAFTAEDQAVQILGAQVHRQGKEFAVRETAAAAVMDVRPTE